MLTFVDCFLCFLLRHWPVVTGSNVFSGGSLCLNRTQGCRKTQPEYFIPHERSNSTQDFTTSSL